MENVGHTLREKLCELYIERNKMKARKSSARFVNGKSDGNGELFYSWFKVDFLLGFVYL